MKISTKGRYALRLMLDLAGNSDGRPVSLRDVSQRQGISDKYLEQIVTPLTRMGLVRSVRGAGGGYLLTRKPEEYTVGEILRPLEGDLAPVECATDSEFCQHRGECATVYLWQEIHRAVSGVVDNMTLADLLEHSRA
ncbi:MAG: RrF2 family transcriptional regulator [Candidatus Enterenecus sp.]